MQITNQIAVYAGLDKGSTVGELCAELCVKKCFQMQRRKSAQQGHRQRLSIDGG